MSHLCSTPDLKMFPLL